MVSEVRDCMRMFPVPAKEPERMLVINEGDFLNIRPEDSAFEALQRLTKRASLKWGIMGLINIIGGNEQYTAAGSVPSFSRSMTPSSDSLSSSLSSSSLLLLSPLSVQARGLTPRSCCPPQASSFSPAGWTTTRAWALRSRRS